MNTSSPVLSNTPAAYLECEVAHFKPSKSAPSAHHDGDHQNHEDRPPCQRLESVFPSTTLIRTPILRASIMTTKTCMCLSSTKDNQHYGNATDMLLMHFHTRQRCCLLLPPVTCTSNTFSAACSWPLAASCCSLVLASARAAAVMPFCPRISSRCIRTPAL